MLKTLAQSISSWRDLGRAKAMLPDLRSQPDFAVEILGAGLDDLQRHRSAEIIE